MEYVELRPDTPLEKRRRVHQLETNMVRRGCPRDLVAFYLGHKNGNTKTLNTHYAATDPAQVIQAFRKYGAVA